MRNLVYVLASLVLPIAALSHSGRTDSSGGHHDYIHGGYHYHSSPSSGGGYGSRPTMIYWPRPLISDYLQAGQGAVQDLVQQNELSKQLGRMNYAPKVRTKKELSAITNAVILHRIECAHKGLPGFQYDLGCNYVFGTDGFPIDIAEALMWLGKAAALGHKDAIILRDECLKKLNQPLEQENTNNVPVERFDTNNIPLQRSNTNNVPVELDSLSK